MTGVTKKKKPWAERRRDWMRNYLRERRARQREEALKKGTCVECGEPAQVDRKFSKKTGVCIKKIVRRRCTEHLKAQARAVRKSKARKARENENA